MLLFMIHNDEASYASFDSIVVSTMFTPYIVVGIIVIVNQRGDIRLKTQLSSSSWHSCEKKIRERKKFDLIFFPPHFNYEGFFFRNVFPLELETKEQLRWKIVFHSSPFTSLCCCSLRWRSIVKELKFSIKNPIWGISFLPYFTIQKI